MPKTKGHLVIVIVVSGIIHGLCEAVAMHVLFFQGAPNPLISIYLPLSLWMLVYHCIDFTIAYIIYKRLMSHPDGFFKLKY